MERQVRKRIRIVNLELIRLSERRPELVAIHAKLREVLEEGEFPEWEQKKISKEPLLKGRDNTIQ